MSNKMNRLWSVTLALEVCGAVVAYIGTVGALMYAAARSAGYLP